MNKNKKILISIAIPILIVVSAFSGCNGLGPIKTEGWDHINTEGTGVRLWGFLKGRENFHNWDGYFAYDTEYHDNWEDYEFFVEADNYTALNTFSVNIFGLNRTTTYHYRAVGEKRGQNNIIRWGVDRTFIPGGPRVSIKDASNIGVDSAVLHGLLTHMGGANCKVFFRYGKDINDLNMETTKEIMTSTGDFEAEITGLTSCQTYYYRAMAENDADTWSSVLILKFTPGVPIVRTYLPNDVTTNSAKLRGELLGLGGMPTCDVWFEYGDKSANELDETTEKITLTEKDQFNIVVENLSSGTTYWVRAVADNSICEIKGEVEKFKTLSSDGTLELPEVPSSSINDKTEEDTSKSTSDRGPIISQIYKVLRENIDEFTFNKILERYPIIDYLLRLFMN